MCGAAITKALLLFINVPVCTYCVFSIHLLCVVHLKAEGRFSYASAHLMLQLGTLKWYIQGVN